MTKMCSPLSDDKHWGVKEGREEGQSPRVGMGQREGDALQVEGPEKASQAETFE